MFMDKLRPSNSKKFKNLTLQKRCFLFLVFTIIFGSGRAEAESRIGDIEVGLALALPSVGLSFRSVLSESRTIALVLGNGAQAQINFTGDSHLDGYFLLGGGKDDSIGLIRAGYGYKWQVKAFSFHLEAALNIPVWSKDLGGYGNLGKVVYAFPIGLGIHYKF